MLGLKVLKSEIPGLTRVLIQVPEQLMSLQQSELVIISYILLSISKDRATYEQTEQVKPASGPAEEMLSWKGAPKLTFASCQQLRLSSSRSLGGD